MGQLPNIDNICVYIKYIINNKLQSWGMSCLYLTEKLMSTLIQMYVSNSSF